MPNRWHKRATPRQVALHLVALYADEVMPAHADRALWPEQPGRAGEVRHWLRRIARQLEAAGGACARTREAREPAPGEARPRPRRPARPKGTPTPPARPGAVYEQPPMNRKVRP